jgi:hypothetical protein
MAMLIFTGLSGLGVVFLLYVLVQFWKEGHRPRKPAMRDNVIDFSRENRPTIVVVTHAIASGLLVPARPCLDSRRAAGGEPTPVTVKTAVMETGLEYKELFRSQRTRTG